MTDRGPAWDRNEMVDRNNPVAFVDISVGGRPIGRMMFELFTHALPKTAENFLKFCTGETIGPNGRPQGYKAAPFHRIVRGFIAQGGDFVKGTGDGSTTIWGHRTFPDEGFPFKHDQAGLLSMANTGKDSNGCQFYITFAAAPMLDHKHVCFGRLVKGQEVLRQLENIHTDASNRPMLPTVIVECGEM